MMNTYPTPWGYFSYDEMFAELKPRIWHKATKLVLSSLYDDVVAEGMTILWERLCENRLWIIEQGVNSWWQLAQLLAWLGNNKYRRDRKVNDEVPFMMFDAKPDMKDADPLIALEYTLMTDWTKGDHGPELVPRGCDLSTVLYPSEHSRRAYECTDIRIDVEKAVRKARTRYETRQDMTDMAILSVLHALPIELCAMLLDVPKQTFHGRKKAIREVLRDELGEYLLVD